jgi:hypothetical protein
MMSGAPSGTCAGSEQLCSAAKQNQVNKLLVPTLGQHCDDRIAKLRKELEAVCVLKAKAEAVQMLDHPMDFINSLGGYPF